METTFFIRYAFEKSFAYKIMAMILKYSCVFLESTSIKYSHVNCTLCMIWKYNVSCVF